MSGELAELANDVTPYVVTAVGAYGAAVLAQAQDEAATAAVGLGRRLAQRVFGARGADAEIPEALADVVDDADDSDNLSALRKAIRKALTDDPEREADVRRLLHEHGGVRVAGERVNAVTNSRIGGSVVQIGEVGGDVRIHRS